jgi:para-aminobenzoate synthetase
MAGEKPLILFIDAYDSFSNNIISLLETTLDASVRTVKIDNCLLASDQALRNELKYYTAVVCGPGPGHPNNWKDVQIMRRIWELKEQDLIPVLGICLGFQSLCMAFGGKVDRLKSPQHGMIRRITHVGESAEGEGSIFEGVGEIRATLYQSLCANLGYNSMSREAFQEQKWNILEQCPDLVPLAWAEWDGNEDNDSGMQDDRILVAARHKIKPFWGLQYHPESICTNEESHKVIRNWFERARKWNHTTRQEEIKPLPGVDNMDDIIGQPVIRKSLLSQYDSRGSLHLRNLAPRSYQEERLKEVLDLHLDEVYQCHTVKLPEHMSVPDIVEILQDTQRDQIILDSSNSHETSAQVRGRYSIIALDVDHCLRFDYKTGRESGGEQHFEASYIPRAGENKQMPLDLQSSGGIWPFLAQFLERRRVSDGNPDTPFWGGFMGITSYELGLEGINVKPKSKKGLDLSLAWVTRSLVIDHEKSLIHVQDLSKKGSDGGLPPWMVTAVIKLTGMSSPKPAPWSLAASFPHTSQGNGESSASSVSYRQASDSTDSLPSSRLTSRSSMDSSPENTAQKRAICSITPPTAAEYESRVRRCQEYIRSGDSYELCLTDQTTVQRHHSDDNDAWSLYRTLRARQPAPFASFMRLGSATLISSSPERFLQWSADGHCSLRPMKGTVRKSAEVSTLAQAKALLDVPKEKAENLMIVDLVRHDLHGICGSGNVSVPRLMVVEEYKSVFQMISVVEGQIPIPPETCHNGLRNREMKHRHTGLDVLAASLPPGSMTGAPKKRSCEILQHIEDKSRSLYSGVVGYMDVGGRGDWSVTIRSMFHWDEEDTDDGNGGVIETWHIGAGGAVVSLSTPEGEREEMLTKLNGTLGIFR